MKEKKFTQLSSTDQHEIFILKSKGYSLRDIAKTLQRNVSSISREINKNSVNGIYDPVKAKVKRYQRRKYCKIYLKKIREHVDLEEYIREKIKCDWSPETISNMWNIDNPESDFTISAKTIYQYCYSAWGQDLCKHLYLKRTKVKKYKKSGEGGSTKRQLIPERVWIDERPEVINNRSRVGDTEGDFIVSKKGDPTVMLTNIDRKSRYVQAKKLVKRTCKHTNNAIKEVLSVYPTVYSLTLDNDILFQHHTEIRDELDIQTYFCHPYHSWEKGQIEYGNRMIRRYIPKKSLLRDISQKEIDLILKKINNTPRKCLGWKTPIQVLQESGVAIEGII